MQIIPELWFSLFMTIPFFVTIGALNVILFKPLREYLEGRDAAIHGAREEASALEVQVSDKLGELETRLAEARLAGAEIRQKHREAGIAAERVQLDAARKQADAQVTQAVAEIAAEAETARSSLEGMAQSISVDIASRVLGRGIHA